MVRVKGWVGCGAARIGDIWIATDTADIVSAIIDPEAEHDAEGDRKLLQNDKATSDSRKRDFRDVKRDNHGQHSNCQTRNGPPTEKHANVDGTCLNRGTDGEDDNGNHDIGLPPKTVCNRAIEEGSKPSS